MLLAVIHFVLVTDKRINAGSSHTIHFSSLSSIVVPGIRLFTPTTKLAIPTKTEITAITIEIILNRPDFPKSFILFI